MTRLLRYYDLEEDPIKRLRLSAAFDAEQIARSTDVDPDTRERLTLALSRIAEGSSANEALGLKKRRGRPPHPETARRGARIAERIHELVRDGLKPTPASKKVGEEEHYDASHALQAYNEHKAQLEDRDAALESIRARLIEAGPRIIEEAIRENEKRR